MVRAKFKLQSFTTSLDHTGKELRTLTFYPVTSGSDENKAFWQYTPSGKIELGTVNPDAWSKFELGKEYFLDFTPAE